MRAESYRSAAGDEAEPQLVPRLVEVGAGVRAAALLAGQGGRAEQAADGGEVAQLPRARIVAGDLPGAGRRPPSRATRPSAARRRAWSSCAAASSRSGTTLASAGGDLDRPAADLAAAEQRPHGAGGARGPSTPRSIASTTRGPNTMPSSSEFDARRLAPITPLQLASPGHPQAGKRRRPVEVGEDAAAAVVRGGRDRQPVRRRGRARPWPARRRSSGSARRSRSRPVASSHRCSTPCSSMRAVIARLTLSRESSSSTNRSPLRVAQEGAVAAQRLGEQRTGHHRVVERGGVELLELDVGHGDAGADRHGHAVAGGLLGVGGDGEQLPVPAGGHEHVGGSHLGAAPAAGRRRPRRGSGRPRRSGRGRTSSRAPRTPRPARRRRASARSPRRSPRPRRARCAAASGRPRGPARARPAGRGRTSAPRAMSSWTRDGPSSTSTRTASTSHSPAPAASVSARWRSVRVRVAAEHGRDPALGPARRGLLELGLGEHAHPHAVDLGGPHRRRQPRHARPQHEEVEVGHRQGLARPEGLGPDR